MKHWKNLAKTHLFITLISAASCVTDKPTEPKVEIIVSPKVITSPPPPPPPGMEQKPSDPLGPPPFIGPPHGDTGLPLDNATLLAEAEVLADQGDYLAAIRKLDRVSFPSPERSKADLKTKDYSSAAVQELRRKASQAFQTARPAADKPTRLRYLNEAKGYLEDAIKNYPDAPQLGTVRDNLSMIISEIEKTEARP